MPIVFAFDAEFRGRPSQLRCVSFVFLSASATSMLFCIGKGPFGDLTSTLTPCLSLGRRHLFFHRFQKLASLDAR
jgi:hypothetical protein